MDSKFAQAVYVSGCIHGEIEKLSILWLMISEIMMRQDPSMLPQKDYEPVQQIIIVDD